MSHILNQRRILTKRYFELTDNSLKISVTKPFKYYEEEFSFEQLGSKVFRKRSFNRYAMIGVVISLIGLLVTVIGNLSGDKTITFSDMLFYMLLFVIISAVLYITATNTTNLWLMDKRYIAFYLNSPNKNDVKNFTDSILSEQKKYLINKYTKREPYMSNEQLMDQLIWLKKRDMIDEPEFESFKKDLLPTIGFTFNANDN